MSLGRLFAVLASCVSATNVAAQGMEGIFGAVGGLMAAAQMQAARDAWSREPEQRLYCLQRLLSREGVNPARLIQAGIAPGDPRLSSIRSQCIRLDPSNLRTGYQCTVADETGAPMATMCDQALGRRDSSGKSVVVDGRAAVDLHLTGTPIVIVDVESPDGRQQRLARVEGRQRLVELARLRTEVEPYRDSRSDVVRAQSQTLLRRVSTAGTADNPPSQEAVEAFRRERLQLAQIEQVEMGRLAALDKLSSLKARVEQRAALAATELRGEAAGLEAEFVAIVNQPLPKPKPVAPAKIEPSFDCAKSKLPIERVICGDDGLKRLDLEMFQPYYVLRHLIPAQREELKQEAFDQSRGAKERCGVPEKGAVPPKRLAGAVSCLTSEYRRNRDFWRARVEREFPLTAREEASRSVVDHLRLQGLLQTAGYIPASDAVDGIYGGGTRVAIAAFQTAEGLPSDGVMSSATASRLDQRIPDAASSGKAAWDSGTTTRIVALHAKYTALEAKFDRADAALARRQQQLASLAEARRTIDGALSLPLPARWRTVAERFGDELKTSSSESDDATVARLVGEFESLKDGLSEAATVTKALTAKNRVLFEGPEDDILILHNDTGNAPSVVRNIKGDLVFESTRTIACQPHPGALEASRVRALNATLKDWNQSLKFPLPRCDLRMITANDLVIVARGQWLKEKGGDIVTLLSALDSGLLAVMATSTASQAQALVQAEAVRALEVEAAVEKGSQPGFALALLETRSSVICMAGVDPREAHEQVLRAHAPQLTEELKGPPTFVATSVEASFIASKRGQCGAVYASGTELQTVAAALRRDNLPFRYFPVWVSPVEVEASQKALADAKARDVQQEADRRRRVEDEKRLASERNQDEKTFKAQRQADLQREHGALARAFEGALGNEMKEFVEGRSERAGVKYPALALWLRSQLQDRWELMTVETELVDYGVSEFKGRSLETAFARTNLKMRNRILGEYRTHCFVTAFVSDKEFSMDREPFVEACDQAEKSILTYRQGQRFTSRWLVP